MSLITGYASGGSFLARPKHPRNELAEVFQRAIEHFQAGTQCCEVVAEGWPSAAPLFDAMQHGVPRKVRYATSVGGDAHLLERLIFLRRQTKTDKPVSTFEYGHDASSKTRSGQRPTGLIVDRAIVGRAGRSHWPGLMPA